MAPTRQVHSNTHCCLWSGHTGTQSLIGAVIHKQESRHKVPKSVSRVVLGRMQFTLYVTRRTPHRASRLVQAMSAWLVKTRRASSRHSGDARVYGQTTTAMHKLSTPFSHISDPLGYAASPPPPPPPPSFPLSTVAPVAAQTVHCT